MAHAMFRGGSRNRDEGGQRRDVARGNGGDSAAKATSGGGGSNVSSSLEALANEEAESVLREVDAIMRTQDDVRCACVRVCACMYLLNGT